MQYPRSDSKKQGGNDNCEALAPFVMSLFDGEADEFEATQARAHLLICRTCADRWLDWNRSRDLLRSVPVPAPPPTQLWRVLMACRLAAFSQQRSKTSSTKSSTNFNGAPADMSAQILARTTRPTLPLAPPSTAKKWRVAAMPAFAVPMMAMWLLFLQREPFLATLSPKQPASVETEMAAPRPALHQAIRHNPVALHPISSAKGRVAPVLALTPLHAPHSEPAEKDPEATRSEIKTVPPTEIHRVPAREVNWSRPQSSRDESPKVAAVRLAPREMESSSLRVEKDVVREYVAASDVTSIAPHFAAPTVKVVWNAPAASQKSRVSLHHASLSDDENEPRLRTARWKLVAPTVSRSAPVSSASSQVLRVSLPTSSAPSAAPARLLAENFEGDDNRVEEMRSVVDDFRATLAPDTSNITDADDDLSRS